MRTTANALGGKTFHLELRGHVPSKKNAWRRRKNGGIGVDRGTQGEIDALMVQAGLQWGKRQPLESPDMEVRFHVRSFRSDRDNKLSCILDVLQGAGVIVSDNTKRFNGTVVLLPSVASKDERTELVITERAR